MKEFIVSFDVKCSFAIKNATFEIVGLICHKKSMSCALPAESMKICIQGFLSMLISNFNGSNSSEQAFGGHLGFSKWPPF